MSPGDSPSDALDRARSYFLVSAVVSNTLTFGAGPSLLKGHDEDAPDDPRDDQAGREPPFRNQGGEENQSRGGEEDQGDNSANNRTSLLPDHLDRHVYHLRNRVTQVGQRLVRQLPWPLRRILRSLYHFLNPPFIGAVIGVTIGLVPPLHQLFFAQTGQGGYLNAWLTESVKRIGELFVTLQVVVVGIKLSLSFRKAKRGQDTGNFPWGPLLFTVFLRFVLWPALVFPGSCTQGSLIKTTELVSRLSG